MAANSKAVTFRLPPELKAEFDRRCAVCDVRPSQVIRALIRDWLKKQERRND